MASSCARLYSAFSIADLGGGVLAGASTADFTVEACREIERRYWRTLTFGEPPMYGADMKGAASTVDQSCMVLTDRG